MKKLFLVLLSLILILGAFVLEGGALRSLLVGSALVPMILGSLVSALFCFDWREISGAFRDAFTEGADPERAAWYPVELEAVEFLSKAVLYWAATIMILAAIGILSHLSALSEIGPAVALGMVSLLTGVGLCAVLLNPMAASLKRKILFGGQGIVSAQPAGKHLN
ncbi:MAG: hypothetical protein ACM3QZ_01175 [Solirubrobacterales bacterium]